jgi:chlorite dismutase
MMSEARSIAEQPSGNGSHGASAAQAGSTSGIHAAHRSRGAATTPRVVVAYAFYRVRPEAFALALDERRRLVDELVEVANDASDSLGMLRSYSLLGLRGDADVLLWQAAEKPEGLQQFAAQLRRAQLYRYLELTHHYLAMTRRSIYVEKHQHEGQDGTRTRVQPAGAPYLFVYPFVKTRPWYVLPMAERQRMMDEHIATGHRYPGVKINTTYSFGLDDQEFVVAFEAQSPSEFLDLVMELRGSEASQYTLRDTPAFTCVAQPLERAFELALGLAEPAPLAKELLVAARSL